jgi:flagellin
MFINPVGSGGSSYIPIVRNNAAANSGTAKSMSRLASGLKIQTAADAPADLAQSERLRALISRYDSAVSNSENASSYIATADGYLQNIQDTMGRMQELAVAANDGTKSETDRAALQAEFGQLQQSIDATTSGSSPLASFNGSPIFQGGQKTVATGPDADQEIQLPAIDLSSTSTQSVGQDSSNNQIQWSAITSSGPGGTNISSQAEAASAVERLGLANNFISTARAQIGAQQSAIDSNISGLRSAQMNSVSAESKIRDLDYAKETVNFVKFLNLGTINRGIISRAGSGKVLAVG